MMIWMMNNSLKYFWSRAMFQIVAFSFLTVTLLMLINFEENYWSSSLSMLAAKHCFDMISNTLDLTAFS